MGRSVCEVVLSLRKQIEQLHDGTGAHTSSLARHLLSPDKAPDATITVGTKQTPTAGEERCLYGLKKRFASILHSK
jgi:hypothetical protein